MRSPELVSEIWFSENVELFTVLDSMEIYPAPPLAPSLVDSNGTYFYRTMLWDPGITYTITITTNLTDIDGNHMKQNFSWQFTTAPEPIPEFTSALLPVMLFLAIALVIAWRRNSGKAIRK